MEWGITEVHAGDNISTVGRQHQYFRGYSVLWRIPCSSVEVVQYSGDNISTVGVAYVLWRIFSILGDNTSTCRGITSVLWRVFSTVREEF